MPQADAMIADDPFLTTWMRTRRPPLAPRHLLAARLQRAAALDELERIDHELEALSARRRELLDRLDRLRGRLWPNRSGHHQRCRGAVDEPPVPPPPPGAERVAGRDLRTTAVALLHRHGSCPLRELHGLLHRYGYVIDGARPVQQLSDALRYEVEQGRCERVSRGVYRAVCPSPPAELHTVEPLPWSDPDRLHPPADPSVADDPERWSQGAWPSSGLDADAPDDDACTEESPCPGHELDESIRRTRARTAELLRSAIEARDRPSSGLGSPTLFERRQRRFAVESVPSSRSWLQKGERWPWRRDADPGP